MPANTLNLNQFGVEDDKPNSFRSFYSCNSSEHLRTTMGTSQNVFDANSPAKGSRRKMAMVVKKPKAPELESSVSKLEGELTNFLTYHDKQSPASSKQGDDGTTSTTSRTTRSSRVSSSEHDRSGRTESSRSQKEKRKSESRRGDDWDWSDHANDWMNIAMGSQNGFPEDFSDPDFPDCEAGDEVEGALNDGVDESALSPSGRTTRKVSRSRRLARQQQIQDSLQQAISNSRRIGDSKSHRSRSKDSCDSDETPPHTTARRRSSIGSTGAGSSSRHGNRTASNRSSSRDKSCRGKSRDRSSSHHQRSTSPSQSRRASRRPSGTHRKPRSRSNDPSSQHSVDQNKQRSRSIDQTGGADSDTGIPYSSASRRGRRRGSMSSTTSTTSNWNAAPAPTALTYSKSESYGQSQSHHARSERGRRRSSMTHGTTTTTKEEDGQERRRGSSLSARQARRRSIGNQRTERFQNINDSYHAKPLSSESLQSKSSTTSRRRHRSRDSKHRSRSKSTDRSHKSIDRSSRSFRPDELLPDRLSHVIERSSNHDSQMERLALAILVAEEGEGGLDQSLHDAVNAVPSHMLDPSNVRLNMQW